MSTLRRWFGLFLFVLALSISSEAFAETYFTDGSDQGFFLVRAKDDVGNTRFVGIFDHAWKVENYDPAAKPVVSPLLCRFFFRGFSCQSPCLLISVTRVSHQVSSFL